MGAPEMSMGSSFHWHWPQLRLGLENRLRRIPAILAAGIYFFASALWILLSDGILLFFSHDNATGLAVGQTYKGLLFIALTTALVYVLLRRTQTVTARASATVVASYRRESDLLDALPDPVVTLDANARVAGANRALAEASGYALDEIVGRSMQDFVIPTDGERTFEAFSTVMRGEEIGIEVTVLRKDGSTIPYEFRGMPLRDFRGDIIGAVASGRDISGRMAAQAALRRNLHGLKSTLRQTISAIAMMVEKRDQYLSGHQTRVTALALAIADKIGLEEFRREGLEHAGICHDIGKIQVPAEILSKPSKLTAAEFSMVREHVNAGYEILSKVEFPWPLAEIVRQHHERLDGSGYPQGLVGDRILLEARILGVADTVEAMTSHRPYRPGLGIEVALAEIKHGSGTLYDPVVVDACVAVFETGCFHYAAPAAEPRGRQRNLGPASTASEHPQPRGEAARRDRRSARRPKHSLVSSE